VDGVATGTKADWPNYQPSAWLRREGWPRWALTDDERGTAAIAVGLPAYPFFVLIDAAGLSWNAERARSPSPSRSVW
jgi:hypothetical protein